jgi:hypothetical protein
MCMGSQRNYINGENRRTRSKSCPSAALSTTNCRWTSLVSNPDLRGRGPAFQPCEPWHLFSRRVKEAIGLLLHGMRRVLTVLLDQKLLQKAYSQRDYSAAEHLILLWRPLFVSQLRHQMFWMGFLCFFLIEVYKVINLRGCISIVTGVLISP